MAAPRLRAVRVGFLPAALVAVSLGLAQMQAAFAPQGGEYAPVGTWGGDQVFSSLSLNAEGGYVVWHDNATDGAGLGIGARRIDASLSGSLSTFRVNKLTAGDQERPQVAMLRDGGAVFVWQGGTVGAQRIYARFMTASGTFRNEDQRVNAYTGNFQSEPAVAVLADGKVIVVWSSYEQDGSMLGVYGQLLTASAS